jgi:hypothetical protein
MFKTQRSKACISSFVYLITAYSAFAQLSGSVSLGGEKKAAPKDATQPAAEGASNQKQITVVGIGLTPEAAEKQAITDAVRQAVGTFIDANTVVKNEEVIKDRILSVSNGFVKEYKPTAPARKRDDGLYEITILATVESSKVVSALKEHNLISGEVAGQNLWAESATKVMKAQDGVAMLEAKLPEFIKNSVTITPLGKDGKPLLVKDANGNEVPSTAPALNLPNPANGTAELLWMFAIGLDNKYYKEQIIPTLTKCFDAITGTTGTEKQVQVRGAKEKIKIGGWNERTAKAGVGRALHDKLRELEVIQTSLDIKFDYGKVVIVKSVSKNLDVLNLIVYENNVLMGFKERHVQNKYECFLNVELYDSDDNLISTGKTECVQPFDWYTDGGLVTGPINSFGWGWGYGETLFTTIRMPIELLKEVKQVKVRLEVPEFKLRLN